MRLEDVATIKKESRDGWKSWTLRKRSASEIQHTQSERRWASDSDSGGHWLSTLCGALWILWVRLKLFSNSLVCLPSFILYLPVFASITSKDTKLTLLSCKQPVFEPLHGHLNTCTWTQNYIFCVRGNETSVETSPRPVSPKKASYWKVCAWAEGLCVLEVMGFLSINFSSLSTKLWKHWLCFGLLSTFFLCCKWSFK